MKVSLVSAAVAELNVDALAVPVAAGQRLAGAASELDRALDGVLSEMVTNAEFRGRIHEVLPIPTHGKIKPRRVILYGLGGLYELDGQRLRSAHHELVRASRTWGYKRMAVLCSEPLTKDSLKAVVEGCVMGTFERRSRQTGPAPERREIVQVILAGFGEGREREVVAAQENGEATNRAREWQNAPPNELTPEALAQEARRIAQRHNLEFEALGPDELKGGGYNLVLGVGVGSSKPPRLIRLLHKGNKGNSSPFDQHGDATLALIGKGITFDSGGISLKDPDHMSRMKDDMSGAGAVLSAIDVIASRNLPLDVIAVIAAAENMPGPSAQRPGDVVVSADGKTVEIVNTDAEGRLVLADALTYAIRSGATHLVDLATLTGAATVAVGHAASAATSNNDEFWSLVDRAAREAGDRVWRLPMYADYRILLRSQIADLRNSEYGEAGTIMGGMFIAEFAAGKPWAHIDIAASAWNTNEELTTVLRGPSGAGTRLCIELAELMAAAERGSPRGAELQLRGER
ncbi:MAG TPA: leucyl aminopeptidase [Candidatus Dormibacteraeota bacterium]|nr:leucyl aminopeptidase [Candidatus Dormibacteraeota bacterium]